MLIHEAAEPAGYVHLVLHDVVLDLPVLLLQNFVLVLQQVFHTETFVGLAALFVAELGIKPLNNIG